MDITYIKLYIIILGFFFISILRMYFFDGLIQNIHSIKAKIEFNYRNRLLIASSISELVSFASKALIYLNISPRISDRPIFDIMLIPFNHVLWQELLNEKTVLVLTIIIWSVLNSVLTFLLIQKSKEQKINLKTKMIVSIISTVVNAPFHLFLPIGVLAI